MVPSEDDHQEIESDKLRAVPAGFTLQKTLDHKKKTGHQKSWYPGGPTKT